ncbi:MAG: 2-oxo acid dehydrogenase subunit E2 [Actinomycetia bacterium]|nr:2-oxo acid dehydrogenase subunit E2 [Actinomycetes bacterium]
MIEFRLPDVGEGLEEAEIITWLVAEGDEVTRDQPLVEILTDKSQTELPAPYAGQVTRLGGAEGDILKVGDLVATIDDGSDGDNTGSGVAVGATNRAGSSPPRPGGRPKASPVVRRRAGEAGIDLTEVVGTGPGGRILVTDLDSAVASAAQEPSPAPVAVPSPAHPTTPVVAPTPAYRTPPPGPAEYGVHPLRGIRRVTAQHMERAWSQIPHIHGFDELDATELVATRQRLKTAAGPDAPNITLMALFVIAAARALCAHPLMNASIDTEAGTIAVHEDVHIGIAVATPDGLVVPVITHADRRGVVGMAAEIGRLSTSARDRSITSAELRGGTFTVTNYGSMGGRFAAPIIRPPEAGIVGFGAIKQQPMVVDGEVLARPTLPIVVGADHRLIDGDVSTSFQEHVVASLSDPTLLLLER